MFYYIAVKSKIVEPQRNISSSLFNNRYLVEIVATIGDSGRKPFTTRHIATTTGLADSVVRLVIRRLRDAGFVDSAGSATAGRGRAPHLLRATSAVGWSELKALCRKLVD
jgi:predicted transcriptional regulator